MDHPQEHTCTSCKGTGRVGRADCRMCQGQGYVLGIGVLRWSEDDSGHTHSWKEVKAGYVACHECGGKGVTHCGTVQDDSDEPELPCPVCNQTGQIRE